MPHTAFPSLPTTVPVFWNVSTHFFYPCAHPFVASATQCHLNRRKLNTYRETRPPSWENGTWQVPSQLPHSVIGVDGHLKWIGTIMRSTTATATVKEMRHWFARYGLPQTVVSDNGTQFMAEEFYSFLPSNGTQHVQTAPYHPSSNGLAECVVQTVKGGVKNMSGDLEKCLQKHLMKYWLTTQAMLTQWVNDETSN